MGIPRKGSRRVTVGLREFLYMIKEKSISNDIDEENSRNGNTKELLVTVQEDVNRPGGVLQFLWLHGHQYGPDDVRRVISAAMDQGWNPSTRGAVYHFSDASQNGANDDT